MKRRRYKSTIARAELIRKLTQQYYEPGNLSRCYKAVWRKYINPVYPMCYETYLNYLAIPTPPPPPTSSRQLTIWDLLKES